MLMFRQNIIIKYFVFSTADKDRPTHSLAGAISPFDLNTFLPKRESKYA